MQNPSGIPMEEAPSDVYHDARSTISPDAPPEGAPETPTPVVPSEVVAKLYVYKPLVGLPSICPRSLVLLFYMRLNPSNRVAIETSGPYPSQNVPSLKYADKLYVRQFELMDIISFLVGTKCDEQFNEEQQNLLTGRKSRYISLLDSYYKLFYWSIPENTKYFISLVTKNYDEATRQDAIRKMEIYADKFSKLYLNNRPLAEIMAEEEKSLENFLEYLTTRITDKKYLLGDKPSSLDAIVCGYLGPFLKLSMPNRTTSTLIKRYVKVRKYVERFLYAYGGDNTDDLPREPRFARFEDGMASIYLLAFACLTVASGVYWYFFVKQAFNK